MKKLLVVGLTPTVQRTLRFENFMVGNVNRAKETLVTASGKGTNVARVATLLGEQAELVQILGGASGKFVAETLDREGIQHTSVWADDDAPTRTCTTLLSQSGTTTELVEEAAPVFEHDTALLLSAVKNSLLDAAAVCLSGSLPPGFRTDFYAAVVRAASELGVPVVIDSQKVPLQQALAQHPYLVKPNRDEALATLDLAMTGDTQTDSQTAAMALVEAGAKNALISMGTIGSLLFDGTRFTRIVPPRVEAVNPIGSGDSLAAGFSVAHFLRGKDLISAARFGTACAAANCLSTTSGVLAPDDVERLLPLVKVEAMDSKHAVR